MLKKFMPFIKNLNKCLFLFIVFHSSIVFAPRGKMPTDDIKIKLSNEKTILIKRIDAHSHYVIIKKNKKILWKKKFKMEYDRLWDYAFFVPIKKGIYEFDLNQDGHPEIAIATWDGGNNIANRDALIFTTKNNSLIYFGKEKFNLEFGEYVYE